MQRFIDYFWLDIDVNELRWYDYMKMFGFYASVIVWIVFLSIYITR